MNDIPDRVIFLAVWKLISKTHLHKIPTGQILSLEKKILVMSNPNHTVSFIFEDFWVPGAKDFNICHLEGLAIGM